MHGKYAGLFHKLALYSFSIFQQEGPALFYFFSLCLNMLFCAMYAISIYISTYFKKQPLKEKHVIQAFCLIKTGSIYYSYIYIKMETALYF